MTDQIPIFLRAHTEVLKRVERRSAKANGGKEKQQNAARTRDPKWPEVALVIDCETTLDEPQTLTFGSYRYCRADSNGAYKCVQEGFFYADDLQDVRHEALSILQNYVAANDAETSKGFRHQLRLLTRSQFIDDVFRKATESAGALVVGFNLPFDLTRLAVDCREARSRDETWSLVMSQDKDPQTGELRAHPFVPRIVVTPKDSKSAFIRFAGVSIRNKKTGQRMVAHNPGRFLDLRTLGWALRNIAYRLHSACVDFRVPGKLGHEPTGQVSVEEIEYCRQDLRATVGLLNAMRAEFERHPVDLLPDRAYSPATIAKAYLRKMGLVQPLKKFDLSPEVLGAAMQAYYGGRAECRIRQTTVPVVHTDFMSEYPTVNTLLGLWQLLTAESVRTEDAIDEVRDLLANLTPDTVFDQSFWKRLKFFALIRPKGDILPVRTAYNGRTTNIGVNPLTSDTPVWYAGPDILASTLLTGRPPEILRAFRVVPQGQQTGQKPVALRGMVDINPSRQDFFKTVIEARARVKSGKALPGQERKTLSYFLKILANAGSYGLFVEVNPKHLGTDKHARVNVSVFSGEVAFQTTSSVEEDLGPWYCPLFASLITAGGRLLLALLERQVTDRGGTYLLCDTDSMAIVASETGGLVRCDGGPSRLPEGRDAVKALSWKDVDGIVTTFDRLNPYDRDSGAGHILKIEDVNFQGGMQRQLHGYSVAAKRYALFTQTTGDCIRIEKASAHGLGFLFPPKPGYNKRADAPRWAVQVWQWILRGVFELPRKSMRWFNLPAMMRFAITTPEVLKVLQTRQGGLPYRDRVKPFNFIQSPILDPLDGHPVDADPDHFALIAPFSSDQSRWVGRAYLNVHDGKLYRLAQPGTRLPSEALPQRYESVVSRYRLHPEAKSLAPDGNACTKQTRGLLRRTPVTAGAFHFIGKETDRRWERGEDISLLDSRAVEYTPNETGRLLVDVELQRDARQVSIRKLAKAAAVSDRTVKAVRRGERLQRSTVEKIRTALQQQVDNVGE